MEPRKRMRQCSRRLRPVSACPSPKSNKGASRFDEANSCWAEGYAQIFTSYSINNWTDVQDGLVQGVWFSAAIRFHLKTRNHSKLAIWFASCLKWGSDQLLSSPHELQLYIYICALLIAAQNHLVIHKTNPWLFDWQKHVRSCEPRRLSLSRGFSDSSFSTQCFAMHPPSHIFGSAFHSISKI